jgi:hypothetical protein
VNRGTRSPSATFLRTTTLTRQQLDDRAWTTPLGTSAKAAGLSGRGLGKLCERHDIPFPPRGSWAKKAAGHYRKREAFRRWPSMATRMTFGVPDLRLIRLSVAIMPRHLPIERELTDLSEQTP